MTRLMLRLAPLWGTWSDMDGAAVGYMIVRRTVVTIPDNSTSVSCDYVTLYRPHNLDDATISLSLETDIW